MRLRTSRELEDAKVTRKKGRKGLGLVRDDDVSGIHVLTCSDGRGMTETDVEYVEVC